MGSITRIPDYGRRLLPALVDDIARDEPDRVLFSTPRNNQPSIGYDIVTAKTFANSVNRLCWWLESHVGVNTEPKTVGYIGQNDLRYFLMMIASCKTGNKLLLSSPRNSPQGHASLIKQSNAQIWITSTGLDNIGFINDLGVPHIQAPELKDVLAPSPVKSYRYEKSWEDGRSDILALLHTSGSTGLPKLVPLYLATAATVDAFHLMEPVNGRMPAGVDWAGTKLLCAMPLFHVAGICLGLFSSIFFRWSIVLPSTGPLMQHVVDEALDNINLDSAFISPSVLQDISKSPKLLEKLSKLKFISSAGGPVAQSVGEVVHPYVPIYQTMGMTEGQWLATVVTHPDEWAYFRFHPRTGYEMRPYSDGLYELTFVKDPKLALTQSVFVTFPDRETWETKDLYRPHPTIPDLWTYQMRKDDLVVLSNGEKFNPLAAEGKLMSHPSVSAAFISGRGRFQTAALLYPADKCMKQQDARMLEDVWPTIENVNKDLPAFAQIHRGFVKIVRSPLPRTPKGTLARNEAHKLFQSELDEVYQKSSDIAHSPDNADAIVSENAVRVAVTKAIGTISGLKILHDKDNFFSKGLDSLHVVRLSRHLKSSFNSQIELEPAAIYANPSISSLSHEVWTRLQQKSAKMAPDANAAMKTLSKYVQMFKEPRKQKENIVITGSTGSIGPYILDVLIRNDDVGQLWCLNRNSSAENRQREQARNNGLLTDWKSKTTFLPYDLSSKTLGLSEKDWKEIQDNATVIIHNAWEVNFNLPLSSFEPHLDGLANLVNFCRETRHKVRFHFISSIGVAMDWPYHVLGSVPEAEITNFEAPVNGYGASKLVAEHLLSNAAQSGIIELSVLRVGQVAGPVQVRGGEWARRDWVPAIIDASAYLRSLPKDLGSATNLDWIPVDLLAEIVGDLAKPHKRQRASGVFYNIVNPKTTNWQTVVPVIKSRLEKSLSANVSIVTFQDWVELLRKSERKIVRQAQASHDVAATRAQTGLKLISFLEGLGALDEEPAEPVRWASENISSASTVFANLEAVSEAWCQIWMSQWGY